MGHDARVEIRRADLADSDALAALRWSWGSEAGPPPVTWEEFRGLFRAWFATVTDTHTPFLAIAGSEPVGMAWLARLPRVIDPHALRRVGGDLQSVYVVPSHRDAGVGERLVAAVLDLWRAEELEAITVSSSSRAVSLYERCGFAVSPRLLTQSP